MAAAKQYWLMKTEPEAFGIADLARVKVEPWTGVRNYQARNFMRDMKVGDDVLFYHSSTDPTGVAGLARVHRANVIDDTQFDPKSKYYDPASKPDAPRWSCVDVAFVEQFAEVLELSALRHVPALAKMVLLQKGSRLSVQPVTQSEFRTIVELAHNGAPKPPASGGKAAPKPAANPRQKPAKGKRKP